MNNKLLKISLIIAGAIVGVFVLSAVVVGIIESVNEPSVALVSPKATKLDVFEDKIEIKAKVYKYTKVLLSGTEIQLQDGLLQKTVSLSPGQNEIVFQIFNDKSEKAYNFKIEANYITPEMKKESEDKAEQTRIDAEAKKKVEEERIAKEAQAKSRQEMIDKQFAAPGLWHIKLNKLIKAGMNDPDSYQHVSTQYWDQGDHLIINTTFRGKNAFGGVVTTTVKAKASIDGENIEIIEQYP